MCWTHASPRAWHARGAVTDALRPGLWALWHRRRTQRGAGNALRATLGFRQPRHLTHAGQLHHRPGHGHRVQVLHRARQVLVPALVLAIPRGRTRVVMARTRGLLRAPSVVRGVFTVRAMRMRTSVAMVVVMAAPAVLHHRVQHRRHGEPVHQDHQSQAGQVASVVGVQQGRGARSEGRGRPPPICLPPDAQATGPPGVNSFMGAWGPWRVARLTQRIGFGCRRRPTSLHLCRAF